MTDDVIPLRFRPHIKCPHCEYPMSRQKDTNFKCLVASCGEGYLRTGDGVKVSVKGNTVIFESGGKAEDIS